MEFDKPRLGPTLGRAAHLAKANMGARVAQFDITPAQTHVLLYLHHHGGQAPQYELTSFLQVKPSTANGVLDRMEEKGLVRRSVSGKDARRRLISITDKGREQQTLFQESFLKTETIMVQGISQEHQALLLEILDHIIKNLEEDSKP